MLHALTEGLFLFLFLTEGVEAEEWFQGSIGR